LNDGSLFDDRAEEQKLLHLAIRYTLLGDVLYKKSYSKLHARQAQTVMHEIHDGDCGNHLRGHSLTHKVINQRYYLPNMFNDVKDYMKKCSECQRFAPALNRPSTNLHTL